MLGGRYGSYYIIRECKTHLNVNNLIDHTGEKTIKTCTCKWKDYSEGVDCFEVRTNKHIGQPLVFKREDFLTNHETSTLYPPIPTPEPVPEQTTIDFSNDTPF